MQDNPFSTLANMLGDKNGMTFLSGTVYKTEPLMINVGGITVLGDELKVNYELLEHDADLSFGGQNVTANIKPKLNAGDEVLLLTTDAQVFYVLCKVVSG